MNFVFCIFGAKRLTMSFRRVQERDYSRLVYAAFAEVTDNNVKAVAVEEVTELVNEGAAVYKVETLDGVFAGVQVISGDEVLYSKFRH